MSDPSSDRSRDSAIINLSIPRFHNNNYSFDEYSISSNAIIVNVATPIAISDATLVLINNITLRNEIGKAGREKVEEYFTVSRQIDQYTELYIIEIEKHHRHSPLIMSK